MEVKEKKKHKKSKKQKHQHLNEQSTKSTPSSDLSFKPSAQVKGLRFGGQLMVRSFTIRRATASELLKLLSPAGPPATVSSSTVAFMPTNFTILAHHAWHTLTLGLGTTNSKVLLFVFDSLPTRAHADRLWPAHLALGDANRRLVRGLPAAELARFKFRKGCITFYVYAVRKEGSLGFSHADDLRTILQSVVALKDFLDHTAMLALPSQRSIAFSSIPPPVAMAH